MEMYYIRNCTLEPKVSLGRFVSSLMAEMFGSLLKPVYSSSFWISCSSGPAEETRGTDVRPERLWKQHPVPEGTGSGLQGECVVVSLKHPQSRTLQQSKE